MSRVREESLDHYLVRTWRAATPHEIGERSGRLCVTAGTIAVRNLKRKLATEDVPPSRAADYTSIEDVARAVLSSNHGTRAAIVDTHLRRRVIEEALEDAQTDNPTTALERLASRVEWDDDTYAQFADELDDYFRASNAGAIDDSENDHETLAALTADLSDPFASDALGNRFDMVLEKFNSRWCHHGAIFPFLVDSRNVERNTSSSANRLSNRLGVDV